MAKIREQISLGSSKEQIVNELHVLPVEERAVLWKRPGSSYEIWFESTMEETESNEKVIKINIINK